MKLTPEKKNYIKIKALLVHKVIKNFLLTISKTIQAVKVNYYIIFSVHGIQQSGKLAWH